MSDELLKIKDLTVEYRTEDGTVSAISQVTFSLKKGETLGLVGETGAGKTTLALSILKLLPDKVGYIKEGSISIEDLDIMAADEKKMQSIRGEMISMIFQDPMTSLNPTIPVGEQISEALELHKHHMTKKETDEKVNEILSLVGISPSRKTDFPHQFSGGMKQRVVIAISLACEPILLLADEPTTALDVTIQAQVLLMMRELKQKLNTSMLLITHDLGVVAECCDRVAIMYAGEIIEIGNIEEIFETNTHHPYTIGLFGSIPDLNVTTRRLSPIDGLMPDPTKLPNGCKFHPRCPHCMNICRTDAVEEHCISETHQIKCHLFDSNNVPPNANSADTYTIKRG